MKNKKKLGTQFLLNEFRSKSWYVKGEKGKKGKHHFRETRFVDEEFNIEQPLKLVCGCEKFNKNSFRYETTVAVYGGRLGYVEKLKIKNGETVRAAIVALPEVTKEKVPSHILVISHYDNGEEVSSWICIYCLSEKQINNIRRTRMTFERFIAQSLCNSLN